MLILRFRVKCVQVMRKIWDEKVRFIHGQADSIKSIYSLNIGVA